MKDALFNELVESVREGGAILRGKTKPSRSFVVEGPNIKHIRLNYHLSGCWLRRWDYSNLLASEPDVKVSLHPAQAWNNAPGCVCDAALTGRGFDTVRLLA
jgi:hypothetical protein